MKALRTIVWWAVFAAIMIPVYIGVKGFVHAVIPPVETEWVRLAR